MAVNDRRDEHRRIGVTGCRDGRDRLSVISSLSGWSSAVPWVAVGPRHPTRGTLTVPRVAARAGITPASPIAARPIFVFSGWRQFHLLQRLLCSHPTFTSGARTAVSATICSAVRRVVNSSLSRCGNASSSVENGWIALLNPSLADYLAGIAALLRRDRSAIPPALESRDGASRKSVTTWMSAPCSANIPEAGFSCWFVTRAIVWPRVPPGAHDGSGLFEEVGILGSSSIIGGASPAAFSPPTPPSHECCAMRTW